MNNRLFGLPLATMMFIGTLTGCSAQGLAPERLTNVAVVESEIASVFPGGYRVTSSESQDNMAVVPCDIHEVLENQGAVFKSHAYVDARLSLEDPTYYRVELLRFTAKEPFSNLEADFKEDIESCDSGQDIQEIGNLTIYDNQNASVKKAKLDDFNIADSNAFRFSYEESRYMINISNMYTDGNRQVSEVFVLHADTEAIVVLVSGRNYKSSTGEFPYFEQLLSKTLESFAE